MNGRRVLLGGGLAALVFNVGGLASAWIMGLSEILARFGIEPTTGAAVLHIGLRTGLGLAAVVVYAGMRRGLGPGPRTATRVGLLVWFIGYVPGSVILHELGVFTAGQLAFVLAWGAAEAVAATVAGAWLYRGSDGGVPGRPAM